LLPKVNIDDAFPSIVPCRLMAPLAVDGNVSLLELWCINQIVAQSNPLRLFEIGTFDGRTSLNMIANASAEARLWTLDLPPEDVERTAFRLNEGEKAFVLKPKAGERFSSSGYEGRITQIYCDSGVYAPGELKGTVDLILVDGSHTFDYVMSDTRLALELMRDKGVIVWHDYDGDWPDVTRALNLLRVQNALLGAMRSVRGTTLVYAHVKKKEAPCRQIRAS